MDCTPAATLRRDFAEQIAPTYAAIPSVLAVWLGGSAALGHADRFSDLELFVAWQEAPTESERADAVTAAGGDLVTLYPVEESDAGPVWPDAWKIGRRRDQPFTGIEVDMNHVLSETVERVIGDVVNGFDPDPAKQLVVGGVLHAVPLYGEALIEGWRRRVATYPDELRLAVVRAHAQIEGLWRLDAYCERGNPIAAHRLLSGAYEQLLYVLLGLNRVYYPGFRSLDAVVADLRIAPADLAARLRASYPVVWARGKEIATTLVEETYDLIEEHLPGVDVERLRTILRYERPLWE